MRAGEKLHKSQEHDDHCHFAQIVDYRCNYFPWITGSVRVLRSPRASIDTLGQQDCRNTVHRIPLLTQLCIHVLTPWNSWTNHRHLVQNLYERLPQSFTFKMKFLHLLAVTSVVGLKFAAAVTCENESDPDSGYPGNWCVASPLPLPQSYPWTYHSATTLSTLPCSYSYLANLSLSGADVVMEPAGIFTPPIHVRTQFQSLFSI